MKSSAMLEFTYLDNVELTDNQLEVTRKTYEDNADKYVLNYERRSGALEEARLFTLDPFLKAYKKSKLTEKILFAGCGSGRDLEESSNEGFSCVGIDISSHMINIGKIMGIKQPLLMMDIEKMDFSDQLFGGIFCETALAHVKKSSLPKVLKNFNRLLVKNGIALITFRCGDGRVYMTEDKVGGIRYYSTVTEREGNRYIKEAGFDIISKTLHQVGKKPPYYNLIVVKDK
jgi:ubiquinone/menaquinone biosynthesis C-methylase UbiE